MPDSAELLAVALDAALATARLVAESRPEGGPQVTATKTTATDIVTEVDEAAERMLVERLLESRPDDGVLGEEGADVTGSSGVTWVIDPIDGTVNFLYGIPTYAVSVAARVGDEVVAGVVTNPVSGETWTARLGHGAHHDGRALRVNPATDLSMALVGTGFGYAAERRAREADVLRSVLPRVRDIRRAGSAALDLCALASGRLDAYFERNLQPWDLAAGGLVAREAGARVGGLGGRDAGPDLVLAAPPALYAALDDLLLSLRADADADEDSDADADADADGDADEDLGPNGS
jgi:myo-inositol-1(or 4)-monophosphatase